MSITLTSLPSNLSVLALFFNLRLELLYHCLLLRLAVCFAHRMSGSLSLCLCSSMSLHPCACISPLQTSLTWDRHFYTFFSQNQQADFGEQIGKIQTRKNNEKHDKKTHRLSRFSILFDLKIGLLVKCNPLCIRGTPQKKA